MAENSRHFQPNQRQKFLAEALKHPGRAAIRNPLPQKTLHAKRMVGSNWIPATCSEACR